MCAHEAQLLALRLPIVKLTVDVVSDEAVADAQPPRLDLATLYIVDS